jgi:hypothetical protein
MRLRRAKLVLAAVARPAVPQHQGLTLRADGLAADLDAHRAPAVRAAPDVVHPAAFFRFGLSLNMPLPTWVTTPSAFLLSAYKML